MESKIIDNIKNTVKTKDIVFFLGDFCWHRAIPSRIIPRLPGKWYWILGNHDKDLRKYLDKNNIEYYTLLDIEIDKQPITLCHYPMVSWNKSHFGAWQLYGHHHWATHNSDNEMFNGPKLNVTVENFDYYPIDYYSIKRIMEHRKDNWDKIRK